MFMKKDVFILLISIVVLVSVVGLVDAQGAFGNLEDFFDVIGDFINVFLPILPFPPFVDPLLPLFPAIELPQIMFPPFPPFPLLPPPACSSRADCLAIGNVDPAPYCDLNNRVYPKVWCFNPGRRDAWCGIHNWGANRRACASSHFCREIDLNGDGIIDSLACAEGVAPGPVPGPVPVPVPPLPPGPPGIPVPIPPVPPVPDPQPVACQTSADCSLPPGEFEVSCLDRDGDGINDELVRRRACCQQGSCSVCESFNNCRYGCDWREDLNPPRITCCTQSNPCGPTTCNNDGICNANEIPGICNDCPLCNGDGVCDGDQGENFNNCPQDCANAICCSDAECGERTYECRGNEVVWTFPRCNEVCTDASFCSEGYAKTDCSFLGKTCVMGSDGKSRCE